MVQYKLVRDHMVQEQLVLNRKSRPKSQKRVSCNLCWAVNGLHGTVFLHQILVKGNVDFVLSLIKGLFSDSNNIVLWVKNKSCQPDLHFLEQTNVDSFAAI